MGKRFLKKNRLVTGLLVFGLFAAFLAGSSEEVQACATCFTSQKNEAVNTVYNGITTTFLLLVATFAGGMIYIARRSSRANSRDTNSETEEK